MALIRQGDVLLRRRAPLTAAERANAQPVARDKGRVILAYGEVTGHAHALMDPGVAQLDLTDGTRVLTVDPVSALLCHEEHDALAIAGGTYEVIRQREYSPEAIRNVAD